MSNPREKVMYDHNAKSSTLASKIMTLFHEYKPKIPHIYRPFREYNSQRGSLIQLGHRNMDLTCLLQGKTLVLPLLNAISISVLAPLLSFLKGLLVVFHL